MEWLFVAVCGLLFAAMWMLHRSAAAPGVLFSGLWFAILGLYACRWMPFDDVSPETLLIIALGVFCFGAGEALGMALEPERADELPPPLSGPLRRRALYLLMDAALAYQCVKALQVALLLRAGADFGLIRSQFLQVGAGVIENATDYYVNLFVIGGIRLAGMAIAVAETYAGRGSLRLWIQAALMTALAVVIGGGRLPLYDLLVFLVVAALVSENRRGRWATALAVCLLASGIGYLSAVRQAEYSLAEIAYNNFVLCVPLMDQMIARARRLGDVTWGALTLRGLIEPVGVLLTRLGLPVTVPAYLTMTGYTNVFYDVGKGLRANAYVSSHFYFWMDGRYVGVVLGNALFGLVCQRFYRRLRRERDGRALALYLVVADVLLRSMIRLEFAQGAFVYSMILIALLYRAPEGRA
ncbi:MAG: oligosaccharide repeat unit polymerase [Clostridia bacterium]|nr:oligosaccharide repeat unit polymerase [Clostridia bacterium]